ncbi:hypothetical protein [Streptomyces sp. NPDC096324]|uniref:hypothetical protein n=1 Tax=Streptomyces sp. NPDC096324 TaxID=3366085 RepID=UPI00381B5D20
MTTATTVAGRTLSGWSRDARHGTWHTLLPGQSGEPVLGALRVDRALLAPRGTRERLAAAVLAVAKLRLPGMLGTVDLVAEAGEVWLVTARPPAPTLADLLASGGTGPDAGSAASVLNETAQTLLALHAAGLAHGALAADTVVLAPDGVALLAEAALGTVLGDGTGASESTAAVDGTGASDGPVPGDAPGSARRAADVAAWADLARTLGEAWVAPGTPAAAVFARCRATAGSEGLAAARAALVAGRAALPEGFLRRTELRAAVAAATAADGAGVDAQCMPPREERGEALGSDVAGSVAARSDVAGSDVASLEAAGSGGMESRGSESGGAGARDAGARGAGARGAESGDAGSEGAEAGGTEAGGTEAGGAGAGGAVAGGAGAGGVVPEGDRSRHTVPDEQLTLPSRTRSRTRSAPRQPRSAAPDDQATLLGKRNRTPAGPSATPAGPPVPVGPLAVAPAGATTPAPTGEAKDDGEILLRFGPGIPLDAQDVLRAQWRTAPAASGSGPRRRRRRAWIATTAFLAVAAVLLWLLLRPSPAPTVTAVEVRAPAGRLHCGQTADLVGVVTTDGRGGPVTYRWLRSDGHDSGELVRMARRGERRVTVHLRWTVRGPGSFRGTARLRVTHQQRSPEAKGTFSYACS